MAGRMYEKMRRMAACGCVVAVLAAACGMAVRADAAPAGTAGAPALITDGESGEPVSRQIAEDDTLWPETAPTLAEVTGLAVNAKGAILIELSGGTVLFEQDAHAAVPIASVTKIMTMLLIAEAVDGGLLSLDDTVTCSEYAASMGGSQIWLEVGEVMTVHEMLKAIAVVSANDCCVAMAEHLCGTAEAFIARMNERAAELGMADTRFLDCCGLNDEGRSSAFDVALMSRELMKHSFITDYTTIWMDSLRDGASELVNTNKLVRHYSGATGLKTGTTSTAGHCLSATAARGGMALCAVVLGCASSDDRFGGARALLDYGFANYAVYAPVISREQTPPVAVRGGVEDTVAVRAVDPAPVLVQKGQADRVEVTITLAENVDAPVEEGQTLGEAVVSLDGETLATYPLQADAAVKKLDFPTVFGRLIAALFA